jgi:DNA replication protein DnaC
MTNSGRKKMDENMRKMLNYTHFKGLLAHWDRYLKTALEKNFSHVRLLQYIVEEEYAIKKENSRQQRLMRAKIPERLVIETFPFNRQPKLNKKKILSLYDSFDYMTKAQNIIWIGPTGTGKTGLSTAFLIQAIDKGYSGRFILFPELIESLYQARGDYSEKRLIKKFASYDCLLIDELGYLEVEPVQVGLFFTLMHKRYGKKTTLVTSNLGFQQWLSFLKNDQLTAALIDRLTENSHVVTMKNCVSLRPKISDESLTA